MMDYIACMTSAGVVDLQSQETKIAKALAHQYSLGFWEGQEPDGDALARNKSRNENRAEFAAHRDTFVSLFIPVARQLIQTT
jgi:hypothetical protein